jgi:hypothetical protein
MSSMIRRMQKRWLKARKAWPPSPQAVRYHTDGVGYDVRHPTKGWKRVCAARVRIYL